MIINPFVVGCAVLAVSLAGLGKGGFAGFGALSTPILALAVGPVAAAAVLLPILIAQDAVSVWAFRRSWDRTVLLVMLPGMTLGVVLGYFYAAAVPERLVLAMLGLISVIFGLQRLWKAQARSGTAPVNSPWWVGSLFGVTSGFCSQVAHAGAPPFQMWVMPRQLGRDELVGTTAIAFAYMNWIKVPAYYLLGQFSLDNLRTSALLLPVAVISTFAGVWLVKRIDAQRLYGVIYVLMILLGIKLLADGLIDPHLH